MNDVATDPVRSARFGEPVPVASERLRMRREGIEHIDVNGCLMVPVWSSIDPTPVRKGWRPSFVAVNLDIRPQKWVIYRRPKPDENAR